MRFVFTTAILFSLCCSSLQAQQNSRYTIEDPNQPKVNNPAHHEYYGDAKSVEVPVQLRQVQRTVQNPAAVQSTAVSVTPNPAPVTYVRPKTQHQLSPLQVNPLTAPRVDTKTQPAQHSLPHAVNPARQAQLQQSQNVNVPKQFAVVKSQTVSHSTPPANPATRQAMENNFVHQMPAEPRPYTRDFFFGVDPDSCCDEWEGVCNCGPLKTNPGHLGMPWLRGHDNCEQTKCICGHCKGKRHCGKCKKPACTCDCQAQAPKHQRMKNLRSGCSCKSCQTKQTQPQFQVVDAACSCASCQTKRAQSALDIVPADCNCYECLAKRGKVQHIAAAPACSCESCRSKRAQEGLLKAAFALTSGTETP